MNNKLDMIALMLITIAFLGLASSIAFIIGLGDFETTLYSLVSYSYLLGGLLGGLIIHNYEVDYRLNYSTLAIGIIGASILALLAIPVALAGMSIYNLSFSNYTAEKIFLFSQGIAEECIFANYIYAMLNRNEHKILANIATASMFMFMHGLVYQSQTAVLIYVFVARIILNMIYEQGGLGASALAHAIVNIL